MIAWCSTLAVSLLLPANAAPRDSMRLVFTVQPGAAAPGATIQPAVQVTAQDAAGQTLTGFTGEITLEITDGTGNEDAELSGTTTIAAVAGVATFADLTIDKAGTGYTLSATAEGFAAATSVAFDVKQAGAEAEAPPAAAPDTEPAETQPTLSATAFDGDLTLDGRLDEPAWRTADSITNLTMIEPEEGGVPAGQTTVKVLASPGYIVFGVVCHDSNPAGIVAFAKTRDFDLELEDYVLIVLDPFQDGRSGYVFAVNPNGARFDGLVAERGEEVNTDWDAIWEAATARDAGGWSIEIRVPIKSLSFKPGLAGWGLNVQRGVQRLLETDRWAGANRDYEIYQTSHAGLLPNLPAFDLGL